MALRIETFDNVRGGNTLYKALTHPHAAAPARALIAALEACGPVAIVDPHGAADGFAEIFGFGRMRDRRRSMSRMSRGSAPSCSAIAPRPVTDLPASRARSVLVAAFDAERLIGQLAPSLPDSGASPRASMRCACRRSG